MLGDCSVNAPTPRDTAVYDRIGRGYAVTRRPDPRIATAIRAALGEARTVVNVGAGAGSYEPIDLEVIAVEPSSEMIGQRPPGTGPVVQAVAEHLPFSNGAFDAAMALLTLHHWTDRPAGLAELGRVARRRVVIFTWDPACGASFWLIRYLPAILDLDLPRFPPLADVARHLPDMAVEPVRIPNDCVDGFLGAFWRRPEAYLDDEARRGISAFAQLPPATVDAGLERLADDLASGRWDQQFGHLRREDSADLGYRLLVADVTR